MKCKKSLILVFVVLFALSCAICLTACKEKGSVYLDKVDVVARINQNGDLVVSETWYAVVRGDTVRNLYRNIDTCDPDFGNVGVEITDVSVTDGNGVAYTELVNPENPSVGSSANEGAKNKYYLYENGSSKVELGCYFDEVTFGKKRVTFNYTLKNMGRLHNDCGELYWRVIGSDFSLYIGQINLDLYLPDNTAVPDDTHFWLHTEVNKSDTSNLGDHIRFTAKDLSSDYFEVRVLSPARLYSGVLKASGTDKKTSIIDREKQEYLDYIAEVEKRNKLGILSVSISCVLGALGILYAVIYPRFFKKPKKNYPEYVREIPSGATVAEVGHFYYYYDGGGKGTKNRNKLMSATILDLARRDFLAIKPTADGKSCTLGAIRSVPAPELNALAEHERVMYRFIEKVEDSYGRPFTLKELTAFAKKNYEYVNNQFNGFLKDSEQKLKSGKFISKKSSGWLIFIGIVAIIVGLCLFSVAKYLNLMGIGFIVFGALLVIFTPKVRKLSSKGEAVYETYNGLKRFMLDFTNLREHELPALILWEEYMVYATMMGISERVLQSLKLKYPALTSTEERNGYVFGNGNFLFTYYLLSSTGSLDLGRSINNCFGNVGATVNAMNLAKKTSNFSSGKGSGFGHGGGGFGGGGGGFGGGGGGAR